MKKIALIITLLTVVFSVSYGQASNDSISMRKVYGGYVFYQGNSRLNMNQLVMAMENNEQAYQEIKSAKSTYTIASIIGFAGGFMVGWPIGTLIGGGEPNWTMAGIGAGLIVVSIPISESFNKKARKAVNTFNVTTQTSSFWDKNELNFSMTENGIGLTLNF
jgi:ABC-type antimicrobial peptide transport system permease subunit